MPISNPNQITEADLEYIFAGPKKKRRSSKIISVLKYTFLALLLAVLIFVGINYQALYQKVLFWYKNEFKNEQSNNQNQSSSEVLNQLQFDIPVFSDNHILIPKISTDAPVTWLVQNTPDETSKALENGAIQLLGSALPGTIGNVFITGHSSNYAWAPGSYKTVFALLDKLVVGDMVYLKYQNQPFAYRVAEKKIVKPNDLSVLEQGKQSILTLMTCTPVGTSLNRLIIIANQIYPNPQNNIKLPIEKQNNQLPDIR